MFLIGILMGALACALILAALSVVKVEQGHRAVITSFGAALRDPGDPKRVRVLGPGLHFKKPWEKVLRVCVMEQNLELSGAERGSTAMAEDGTVLRFDSILRYAPLEEQLGNFLFHMHQPLEHMTGLFTCLLRNEIANVRAPSAPVAKGVPEGSYAVIRRERKELNRRLEALCREKIAQRYGVSFSAVDLVDILPPDELETALNAVMNARAESDELLARTEAECQRRLVAAERGIAIAKARAEAAETEIERLAGYLETLAKEETLDAYVERRRAEVQLQARTTYMRSA